MEDATLTPSTPVSELVTRVHYQRWVCVRMGRDQTSNEVAESRATVDMMLTLGVGADGQLQIVPEIKQVSADRFLADLLRTGELGNALRERVVQAMLGAIAGSKGALPASAKDLVRARNARFESTPGDYLSAIVSGELRISDEQTKALGNELKERVAAR